MTNVIEIDFVSKTRPNLSTKWIPVTGNETSHIMARLYKTKTRYAVQVTKGQGITEVYTSQGAHTTPRFSYKCTPKYFDTHKKAKKYFNDVFAKFDLKRIIVSRTYN